MLRTAHELQQVSEHMDWDKLRDQYLLAIYSEEPSNHRKLKKRAHRPRHNGPRKDWNVNVIENNLKQEAAKAMEAARGVGSQKGSNVDAQKDDPHGVIENAMNLAQSAGTMPNQSHGGSTKTPNAVDSLSDSNSSQAAKTDEFPISVTGKHVDTVVAGALKDAKSAAKNTTQQGDDVSFNGKPIENYSPSKGNCPGPGDVASTPIPCAPDNLSKICNKYDDTGTFRACFEACKPSFCCVHGKQFGESGQI